MKFTIQSSLLRNKLNLANKFVSQKSLMPIMECLLIECGNDAIKVTAGDDEKSLTLRIPVEGSGEGKFCVTAKKITDSLKNLGDQPITFEYNKDTRSVTCAYSSGSYSLVGDDPDTYPLQKEMDGEMTEFKINSTDLLRGINLCMNAAADDEIRKVMTCVCIDRKDDGTTFVATDGRKLVRHINRDLKSDTNSTILITKKVAATIRNVMPNDLELTIRYNNEKIHINADDMAITVRLMEGNYLNYNAVIPTECPNVGIIEREKLLKSLKRSGVFCSKESGLIKAEVAKGSLTISAKDVDFNTAAEEKLPCEYDGAHIKIGLNCFYMQEMLSALECDKISVGISESSKPMLIKPTEEKGETSIIVMPMLID